MEATSGRRQGGGGDRGLAHPVRRLHTMQFRALAIRGSAARALIALAALVPLAAPSPAQSVTGGTQLLPGCYALAAPVPARTDVGLMQMCTCSAIGAILASYFDFGTWNGGLAVTCPSTEVRTPYHVPLAGEGLFRVMAEQRPVRVRFHTCNTAGCRLAGLLQGPRCDLSGTGMDGFVSHHTVVGLCDDER